MKDYHINIFDGENETGVIVLTKDINRKGFDYIKNDPKNAWKKMFILEPGMQVIDIFGCLVTVKEVLYHENTQTINYLIEENDNCYRPGEFAGVFVKYLSNDEFQNLVNP